MSEHTLLNTLYITTPGGYLHLDNDTVRVEKDEQTILRVPLHHLGGVVVFGHTLLSPGLLHRCADDGRQVVWLDFAGRFKARLSGAVSGNVLLRRDQYTVTQDPDRATAVARRVVAGKLQNCRTSVMRSAREAESGEEELRVTARVLADLLPKVAEAEDTDTLRGLEGHAARTYFGTFNQMMRVDDARLAFVKRTRRPPRDPINALLSFLYTLLAADCVSAAESVGLDPQMGCLHGLRPGRPALALDLMEELRPALADRLVLTLINRQQVTGNDFEERPGGAVEMSAAARKTVIVAWQERKQEEVHHPVLDQKLPWGLVPHVQARLMARVFRGEMEAYEPFLHR